MELLPTTTSADERDRQAREAVLPIGSFEQHGEHHPLITDTVVAMAIASRLSQDYDLMLLPPITVSCSHEHAAFAGSVSIRATTLAAVVNDIAESLAQSGIRHLVVVNGHGGNYVLRNVVQEANVVEPRMILFPGSEDWAKAREAASMETSSHDDMHAGELETSILLHAAPELLRSGFENADWEAGERPHLLLLGMAAYTASGVIGRPSLGSAEKGSRTLGALSRAFAAHLRAVRQRSAVMDETGPTAG